MSIVAATPLKMLIINEDTRSYHRILHEGKIIEHVGFGRMSSHGHPYGNQQFKSQKAYLVSYGKSHRIPVFYTKVDGTIHLLGKYIVDSWSKKLSNEGFAYFCFKLRRVERGSSGV
jgi:hypothetical protein